MLKKSKHIISELIDAFQDHSGAEYFFDAKKEEVIFISEISEDDERDNILRQISSQPGRYFTIYPEDPRDGYNDMSDFIEGLSNENQKEKLRITIRGKGAFRRFNDLLLDYPVEREAWFKFKENRTKKRINRWLELNGIGSKDLLLEAYNGN